MVCPPTLCGHWVTEVNKFISPAGAAPGPLRPLLYAGPRAARAELARALPLANLVVTSYEAARADVELLEKTSWNYLVLDEGHVIKNAKTKTTQVRRKILIYSNVLSQAL